MLTGQKLLDSLAETWDFFFSDVLPALQAIFYPVQVNGPRGWGSWPGCRRPRPVMGTSPDLPPDLPEPVSHPQCGHQDSSLVRALLSPEQRIVGCIQHIVGPWCVAVTLSLAGEADGGLSSGRGSPREDGVEGTQGSGRPWPRVCGHGGKQGSPMTGQGAIGAPAGSAALPEHHHP